MAQRAAEEREAKEKLNEMSNEMEAFLDGHAEALESGGTIDIPFDSAEITPDMSEMDRLAALNRSILVDGAALQNEYMAAIADSGWNEILNGERIIADEDFTESERILTDAGKVVEEATEKSLEFYDNLPDRLDRFRITGEARRGFLDKYRAGYEDSRALLVEQWELESKTMETGGALVRFLHESRARWEMDDGLFLFETDEDLERFNKLFGEMNKHIARSEEIAAERQKTGREALKELRGE